MEGKFYCHVFITTGADTKESVPGYPYCQTWTEPTTALAEAIKAAIHLRPEYPEAVVRIQIDYE